MLQIKLADRANPNKYNCVERQLFQCLEIMIPKGSEFLNRAYVHAGGIVGGLNSGQANTSEIRKKSIVEIDNLCGMIAEFACKAVLQWIYGNDKIFKPDSSSSINQIDLKLYSGKTIEVRSSCVRNGIDFALFFRNKEKPDEQYFDVIGPYSNNYKPGEILKDYYMRVLYECDKTDFMRLLETPDMKCGRTDKKTTKLMQEQMDSDYLRLYITGGATKNMMEDEALYQLKHLLPSGGEVRVESDYRVIPLAKSLDIGAFVSALESENDDLKRLKRLV